MVKKHVVALALGLSSVALATDIEGVQPAALDQPRVNIHLRREPKGKALGAKGEKGEGDTINIQAFLDTGASGILLSGNTAKQLGVKNLTAQGKGGAQAAKFHDIGVGGGEQFDVSEKLFVFVAPYSSKGEPDDASEYPVGLGPVRTQISAGGGLIEMLTGGLDVLGMPAIKGHIIVIDPKPVDTFSDMMRCELMVRGKGQIPKTDRHVKLTMVDFKPFTHMEPASAEWPTLAANPMMGPNPLGGMAAGGAGGAGGGGVVATYKGQKTTGTWLLDTGAAASMISTEQAKRIGVTYVQGTVGTDDPRLDGVPKEKQFSISIGGIGGTKKVAGFFLDTLVIPTREGDPLVYKPAPVLVNDITAENPTTKQKITLDGVFGMNFLAASAHVTQAGLLPDIKDLTAGPFEAIVIDEPQQVLGVKLKK
ncbi:MAG TPA: hypothetical protein VF669_01250 [Tepidisphaeraceae bacterium]|jgi:hypothetical protein